MARIAAKKNKKVKEESLSSSVEESITQYSDNQLEQVEENLKDIEVTSSNDSQSEIQEESVVEEISSDNMEATGDNSNEESTASGSQAEEEDDETLRTIFIKDLDYDVREDDIKKQMVRLGNVIRVTVPMSHDQRRNKGFAYVEFKTVEEAKKALKLDGSELLGRKVMVSQARAKSNKNIFTVFCKNLSYSTTKEDLKEHFEQFGKVFNISLPVDSENKERNKGFCFVEYTDRDVVDKVLKAKHMVNDRLLYLNEGNKNEERNQKRSNDRLYGRSNESERRGGDRRDNDRFDRNRRDSDRRDNGRRDNDRFGGNRRDNDRRGSGFRKENNFDKKQDRSRSGNKKVFDDSD